MTDRKEVKKCGRFIQFALAAASMAVEASGLCIDAGQQLFVADAYNRRIQVFQILSAPEPAADDVRGSKP